eukprot:7271959-Prymnesium_polylepis.1
MSAVAFSCLRRTVWTPGCRRSTAPMDASAYPSTRTRTGTVEAEVISKEAIDSRQVSRMPTLAGSHCAHMVAHATAPEAI